MTLRKITINITAACPWLHKYGDTIKNVEFKVTLHLIVHVHTVTCSTCGGVHLVKLSRGGKS